MKLCLTKLVLIALLAGSRANAAGVMELNVESGGGALEPMSVAAIPLFSAATVSQLPSSSGVGVAPGQVFLCTVVFDNVGQNVWSDQGVDLVQLRSVDSLGTSAVGSALAYGWPSATVAAVPSADVLARYGSPNPANSCQLQWTAPGDDGTSGQASSYQMRSGLTASSVTGWTAPVLSDLPNPAVSGSQETYRANGLNPQTKYYFGIRTADESGNWSGISNVVSYTTASVRMSATFPVRIPSTLGRYVLFVRLYNATGGYFGSTVKLVFNVLNEGAVITTLAGDLTGDGKGDVVVVTTQGVYLYRSTGSSFVYDGKIGDPIPKANLRYRLADVEGMGRKQLITFRQDLGFFFQRYDPADSPPLSPWYRIQDWGPRASDSIAVGDVDGNGREDIIGTRTGEEFVLKSGPSNNGTWLNLSTFNRDWSSYPRKLLIGDATGEGREDLLFVNSDGMYSQPSSGSAFGGNNRLTSSTCLPDTPYVGYFTSTTRIGFAWRGSGSLKVLGPSGAAGYSGPSTWSNYAGAGSYPMVADVDGDGYDDLVFPFLQRREITALMNNGGTGFVGPLDWYLGTGGSLNAQVITVMSASSELRRLEFGISQNPVREAALFQLSLPNPAHVRFSVYDVGGRRIGDSVDRFYPAGQHRIEWISRGVPAGMYFGRFEADGAGRSVKFTILR